MLHERSDESALSDARRPREAYVSRIASFRIDRSDQLPPRRVVVLDQRDAARERALVAREQALASGVSGALELVSGFTARL